VRITVTARHCEIDAALRERAVELIEKIAKLVRRAQRAEVVFDNDHKQKVVEFQLYVRGGLYVSTAEADDFRTALDRAADKLRNQLDKLETPASRRTAVGEE
jgi:ribosomal subunit interface protein